MYRLQNWSFLYSPPFQKERGFIWSSVQSGMKNRAVSAAKSSKLYAVLWVYSFSLHCLSCNWTNIFSPLTFPDLCFTNPLAHTYMPALMSLPFILPFVSSSFNIFGLFIFLISIQLNKQKSNDGIICSTGKIKRKFLNVFKMSICYIKKKKKEK